MRPFCAANHLRLNVVLRWERRQESLRSLARHGEYGFSVGVEVKRSRRHLGETHRAGELIHISDYAEGDRVRRVEQAGDTMAHSANGKIRLRLARTTNLFSALL